MKKILLVGMAVLFLGLLSGPVFVVHAEESVESSQYFDDRGITVVNDFIQKLASPITLATILAVFVLLAGVGAYLAFGIIIVLLFMRK